MSGQAGEDGATTKMDALEPFREHIIQPWKTLRRRLAGSVVDRRDGLAPNEQAMLTVLADGMSLLAPLNATRKERLHQAAFVWALTHPGELGDACRRAWAQACGFEPGLEGWQVTAEHRTDGDRRVDVRIEVGGHALQLIEMKVDAAEAEAQLADYQRHLVADAGTWVTRELVFLTPDGRRGDAEVTHRTMAWTEVVRAWLPVALAETPEARYLAMWLVSLAREVCKVSDYGPFDDWSIAHQRATLDLLEGTRRAHV